MGWLNVNQRLKGLTMTGKSASDKKLEEREELSEKAKEAAKERAEEAQDQAPENAVCELCNRPIEEGQDWKTNKASGALSHKDGCPEPKDQDEPPKDTIKLGGDEYTRFEVPDKASAAEQAKVTDVPGRGETKK